MRQRGYYIMIKGSIQEDTIIINIYATQHAVAAKSRQLYLTLCDPKDGSPPCSGPRDSPSKNTGVGCHFLLQCMKVKSESEVIQSCPTLHNPVDCSLLGSSVHEISQARVLEWVAMSSFRESSQPRD